MKHCVGVADIVFEGGNCLVVEQTHVGAYRCEDTNLHFMPFSIAVRSGKIVYVGPESGLNAIMDDTTRVVDLHGKWIVPAFVDAHCHPQMAAGVLFAADLTMGNSVGDYEDALLAYIEEHPGCESVRGQGWRNPVFAPNEPTKEILDSVSADIPICLESEDGHSLWVNSKALEMAGVTKSTPDPVAGRLVRYESGEPTGLIVDGPLYDKAYDGIPDYSVEQYEEALLWYQKNVAHPYGVTAAFDGWVKLGSNALSAYRRLAESGKLKLRIRTAYYGNPEAGPSQVGVCAEDRREIGGGRGGELFDITSFKIFIDGVIEGKTAFLSEPYSDSPEVLRVIPLWDWDTLAETCAEAVTQGFALHFHAIGDAAVSMSINALEYVRRKSGKNGDAILTMPVEAVSARSGEAISTMLTETISPNQAAHSIAHIQLAAPADIERIRDCGATASLNPWWWYKDDYYWDMQLPYLGAARAEREYPAESFFRAGVPVSFGSDFPVTDPPNPMYGMQVGITRTVPGAAGSGKEYLDSADLAEKACGAAGSKMPYGSARYSGDKKYSEPLWPDERATVEQMLHGFTMGGALALGINDVCGSIEPGKSADLAILDRNPLECPAYRIKDIRVMMTVFRGEIVYER